MSTRYDYYVGSLNICCIPHYFWVVWNGTKLVEESLFHPKESEAIDALIEKIKEHNNGQFVIHEY